MRILNWINSIAHINDLRIILESHRTEISSLRKRLESLERTLKERTDIAVDVAYKGQGAHHVIIVGRYKKQDFVQTYAIEEEDLHQLIYQLRDLERYARVTRIDGPPGISAAFKSELYR